jgi:hypothetical protein
MILAADYPFLDIVGTMLVFFFWVMWFWCLIIVLGDVFRRKDLSGWSKALWTLFLVFLPWLGVLIYLIAHGKDMGERRLADAAQQQAMVDGHIRHVASSGSGSAEQIVQAKKLLDDGAIDAAEYDQLKRQALAA